MFPESRKKNREDGENLQTPGHHDKRKQPLAFGRIGGEIAGRAARSQSRTDVAHTRDGCADRLVERHAIHHQEKAGDDNQRNVDHRECQDAVHHVHRHRLLVKAYRQNRVRMRLRFEGIEQMLHQDGETPGLETSAGRARTTANHHQEQRDHPEERPPRNIIGRRIPCSRNQGSHHKKGVAESCFYTVDHPVGINPNGRNERRDEHDSIKPTNLFVFIEFTKFAIQEEIDKRHVRRPDAHEKRKRIFDVGRIPIGDAGVLGRETAGRDSGHRMVDGIEKVHGT